MDRYRFDGSKVGAGDLYGLPKDVGPWAFVYNKDLFDKAGVSYPSATAGEWTWDDMLEAAQKLTVDNNGDGKPEQYGVGAYSLESAVWGNGGEYIDYATGTVKVNEPAFYEAMQFVADLNLKFKVSPNQEAEQAMNAYTRFINGQLGMFAMGPWDQPAFWELPSIGILRHGRQARIRDKRQPGLARWDLPFRRNPSTRRKRSIWPPSCRSMSKASAKTTSSARRFRT